MKLFAPDYYKDFHCIADKCLHSCCRGWEIDIDPQSLERFRALGIGNIDTEPEPHFILRAGDVCPFLEDSGLCRLILDHGEDVLCNICRDHPRFRNFWTGFAEVGLGLSCEEAARIILSRKEPAGMIVLGECDDDGVPIAAEEGAAVFTVPDDLPEDEEWLLEIRRRLSEEVSERSPMEQRLFEYLVFRHLPDALYDGRLEGRIGFIRHSFDAVTALWQESIDKSFEALCEIARSWSEAVEYNEEKKDALIEAFESEIQQS